MRVESAERRLPVEVQSEERGHQSEVIELHRTKIVRDIPHLLQHQVGGVDAFPDASLRRRVVYLPRQRFQVEADAGEDLADLVVQLTREVAALGFDGAQKAPGQLPQPMLHAPERAHHRHALGHVASDGLDLG